MSRQIADNFRYDGKQFLDDRASVTTIAELKTLSENYFPDGFICFCSEDGYYYEYKSNNTNDGKVLVNGALVDTAKWRRLNLSSYTGKYLVNDVPPETIGVEIQDGAEYVFYDKYYKYKGKGIAKLVERFKISDAAAAQGWSGSADGIQGSIVDHYEQTEGTETKVVKLGALCFVPNSADVVLETDAITVDSVRYSFGIIELDQVDKWVNQGKLKQERLIATEILSGDDRNILVNLPEVGRHFNNLINYTPVKQAYEKTWEEMTNVIYSDLIVRKVFEVADDGVYAKFNLANGPAYDLFSELEEKDGLTKWYHDEFGWHKIYPLDNALDEKSSNAVTNAAVTRAIHEVAHTIDGNYEKENKLLGLELKDAYGTTLNKLIIGLGEIDPSNPKIELVPEKRLFKRDKTVKVNFKTEIKVEKGGKPILKVELYKNGTKVKTYEGDQEITGETQTLEYEVELQDEVDTDDKHQVKYVAKVYDTELKVEESEECVVKFIYPCLHNPTGTSELTETLNEFGLGSFGYTFDYSTAVFMIPQDLLDEFGEVRAIMGGQISDYTLVDYTQSFLRTSQSIDEATYAVFTLMTPCKLTNFLFVTEK